VAEFVAGNRTVREATGFTNRTDAAKFPKKRITDALGGKMVLPQIGKWPVVVSMKE
jgi:hypothetical protein